MTRSRAQREDISRPVTLYVEKVDTAPTLQEYFETKRTSVIDIEITAVQAVQIIEYIHERNRDGANASIRIRFMGRLVHL